ncbi:hypothetical protein ACTFIW_000949 [Dictyostelium discoideum]
MSTTVNNNDASSSSTSASNNAESFDLRMKSMEDQINNLSLAFTRFMKEPMFSSNTNSRSQRTHDDSDTENEQSDDESSNNVDVPTDYQLSDTLLGQYKHMVNNQGLLVEEECILKKDEISELNKVFNFPSNFQVNVAPFGTPEGITVSSTVKNNDTDLLIVEKRINDSLKPLLLMSTMLSSDSSNVDVELISYLAQSAIVLAINAQASLSRVRRNNIAKEIYGSEVLLPIKIKDTPKMFDETETERVRKLAKSIRKNNEAKQSLLKLNYHSKSNAKKSVNSSGNNTTGNSSNSKSSSGSNGRSNNFNGSPSNVASGSNNTKSANEEQEVNLPVGGRLFHHKQVWKELGLPNFCQEVVNGLKVHLLPNFKPMPNPIPFSIPEGPKSDCITKEVQDLLLDDAIEQVLPNRYSKRVFYSNVFTVPKPGTTLHRPVLDLKRLNTYINNQSFKMEGIKNLPSMVKQGYYMVKLDIKKAYLHVLVDPQYRDLFRFVWKGSHYRWKTMPLGLSTAPRIFTMMLRPVLRMLRDINVSVIAYLDDLLIVGSTKEECLSKLKKTMGLLVKLGCKLNLEKSVLEPTQSITFLGLQIDSVSMKLLVPKEKKKSVIKEIRNFLKLDCCSPRKLAGLKGKLIALKDAVIPFRLYTRRTNKFHSQCLTLANGDWDQSFPIHQDVKSEISHWLTVLNQWNGKEISLFPSYDYVLTTDASKSGAGATLKKGNKIIKTWSFQWPTTQSDMSSNRREMLALLMAYQALWWSDTGPISSVRTTLETMPQEESELDWRAYSRILQCKSRPPQPSFRDESQIIFQSNRELQLATEERSVQSHPTSVRSNPDGSVRISPEPSNVQLLNNQNECTPPRLGSMEAMSGLPTTHSFAFYPGEDELIQFEEGFYNTDLPNLEISNLVSDDSSSSSSSSSSHVSSSTGNIPRSIDQTISRVNTNPNSTTLETGDYSTFQSHVMSIIRIQRSSTAELLMKSWEPSTLKVYSSSYTRFRNFCISNSLNPANITLVVFMDYLTHLFNKELINDEEDELLYTIKFDKETNKPIISLLHSTGTSDTSLIPTLKCLIVPNKENMDKPRIIINSHSKEEQFKLILDTGSNVSLINKRLISKEMKNHVHKTKAKINFPLLDVKEEFVEQINIQVNNEIHTFFIIELDIIDVLFGNDILKDSIINQKDKIIKLNNSTYKINYQQSNQLHCNIKAPRKHVAISNDNKSESHNLLEDDEDIKEQVTKFVEIRDFINDSFEDVIVDKLPDIPDQINNSRRDQDVEPTKKQIYYSTDDHKRHVEEIVLKFIDLVTVRDDHPFTPVDSLLNQCKDSKLFSKFDMIMGYFQVLINPEHAKYTAFITHIGKFEYTRMPQGLVKSPSTFARLMVEIFGKIISLLQYFDDLLVHSKLDYMVHFIEII